MAQGRQQNNGSRQRCAQSAAAKAPAEPPKAVCAQLEQMNRKLAAASAEILRYQTRLFACERQMAALRQENAQLEAACEQARQEAECASAHAEQLRQELPCGGAPGGGGRPAMRKLCGLCRLRRIRPRSRNHRQRRVSGRSRRPNSPHSPGRRLRSLLSRTGSPRPDWSTSRWS